MLLARDRRGHSEDEALLICVPAKVYWANLIERLLTRDLDTHEDKRKRLQRLEDYDRIVADGATVKEATASALAVLRDAKIHYSTDMLQLFVGGKMKFWGASVQPEPSGPLATLHRRLRSQMLEWLRLFDQLHFAALPAVLTTVCSVIADGVGLAVSSLITSRLEGLVAVLRMAAGDGLLEGLLQHGIASTVLYLAQWRQLKETLSLFIVPYLLALLRQLFPSAEKLRKSGESQLIMQSTVRALERLSTEYDHAEGKSRQDVVGVFMEYTQFLRLPPLQARQAQQVLSASTSTHKAVTQLLQAASATELMKALFGVAQAVLFGTADPSVIIFARSASVVLGGVMRRGSAIWTEAGFIARHGKALQTASRLRSPLAIWSAVSTSTSVDVGSGRYQTSSSSGVAEVVEALDGAYRIRVAEDLHMTSCQHAPQILRSLTREWLQASSRFLFSHGDMSTKPAPSEQAAPETLALRSKFHEQITTALMMTTQDEEGTNKEWPDLATMNKSLALYVYAWEKGRTHRARSARFRSHSHRHDNESHGKSGAAQGASGSTRAAANATSSTVRSLRHSDETDKSE